MKDFEKRIFEEIKFKKKIDHLSEENKEMKETIKGLASTVEDLKRTVKQLQRESTEVVNENNILQTLGYAIERVREFESEEDE